MVSLYLNALALGMNLSLLTPTMNKLVGQTGFSNLDWATQLEEGKLSIHSLRNVVWRIFGTWVDSFSAICKFKKSSWFYRNLHHYKEVGRVPIMYKLDCSFEVSEFEPQSCYYVQFQTNTFWKSFELLISQTMT